MSRFGNLVGGNPEPDPAPISEPVIEPVVVKKRNEKLWHMSKDQLEEYGRSLGIELDKRLSKAKLVACLENYLESNS